MSDAAENAEARVRAAIAVGESPRAVDIDAVLAELERWRAVAAERWAAIGALAPRAKELRLRAQDLQRAALAARDRLDAAIAGGQGSAEVHAAREVLTRALGGGGLE